MAVVPPGFKSGDSLPTKKLERNKTGAAKSWAGPSVFLATHFPITGFEVGGSRAAAVSSAHEQSLLDALSRILGLGREDGLEHFLLDLLVHPHAGAGDFQYHIRTGNRTRKRCGRPLGIRAAGLPFLSRRMAPSHRRAAVDFTVKTPQKHREFTVISPWNHRSFTVESPWNHRGITAKRHGEKTVRARWNHPAIGSTNDKMVTYYRLPGYATGDQIDRQTIRSGGAKASRMPNRATVGGRYAIWRPPDEVEVR